MDSKSKSYKTRGMPIFALTSTLLISAIHSGNIYASMPSPRVKIKQITPKQIVFSPNEQTEYLEVEVIQNGQNQTYNFMGGINLGGPRSHLPHELYNEIDIAQGRQGNSTSINFLKAIEGDTRHDFNDYPFGCCLRAIFMNSPEWQSDIDWLNEYNCFKYVQKFALFLKSICQYLEFWERFFQERGDGRLQQTIDHYKELIMDTNRMIGEVLLVGVKLTKEIFGGNCFLGIKEKLGGKPWEQKPIPFILPFADLFSPAMLLWYAIENNVILYDMQFPCASLRPILPPGLPEHIFSSLLKKLSRS
ncbi:MAG: hypothetical protein LBJ13_03030 [Puniceicoccales bacterium]|jgi:hypothetical protein|nr:hypothetical protein [Puniceicoccales bacterium]